MRSFTARAAALLVVIALAAACSSTPSTSPASPAGSGSTAAATDLTGKTWEWTAMTTTSTTPLSVIANPTLYTIRFNDDGTAVATANCNTVQGTWTSSGSNALTIKAGVSTLAQCVPSSLDQAFLTGLARTSSYRMANAELTLGASDGATMTFR
ncbi:MAG TPA: META domain-containing protein [Candidatus Limnocylindrales bacterium]|nr:META domain-containing protein [Candidatus Limnocylindrales bacterium]